MVWSTESVGSDREFCVHPSLTETRPAVFWMDRNDAPEATDPLTGSATADLVVVGGGFTGLWTALLAAEADPGRRITVLEAGSVGIGATGRNGGFCDASLTHGIDNGLNHWPDEMPTLLRLGADNLTGILDTIVRHGIDCGTEATGETDVAVEPWQVDDLAEAHEAYSAFGVTTELLDAEAMQADVHSPTYLAGLRRHGTTVLVDPARLAWGLRATAQTLGVTVHEGSPVRRISRFDQGVVVGTDAGRVAADRAVVATNAFARPLRRVRNWVLPVYDHVLVTEPLSADQRRAVGWTGRQGMSDAGNQFHYYRLTADDRILWGGYDALYHFGNRIGPGVEHSDRTADLLAHHFFTTFPQLEGLRFTHRWGGPVGTTSRFTCAWGTAHQGRTAWAAGYTGLGVGASRFGAQVALDLVDGHTTERTELEMVRRRPVPIPPEPARWVAVQAMSRALKRADRRQGRRGPLLRLLDRFGIGFDS